jgi:AcrR family transcriptional regulator
MNIDEKSRGPSLAPEPPGVRKKDRRVAYTRMVLRNALVELMQDQHISGITVKSICKRADVNRSTFYLHYRDQYDLLHQAEREVLEALGARLGTHQDTAGRGPMSLTALTEILEYAQEHSDIARIFLSENCDFAFRQDIMELAQIVVAWIDPSFSENTQDYVVAFVVNGCIAFAEKWLENGMVEPPGEIARLMLQLLSNGTASFAAQDGAVN